MESFDHFVLISFSSSLIWEDVKVLINGEWFRQILEMNLGKSVGSFVRDYPKNSSSSKKATRD